MSIDRSKLYKLPWSKTDNPGAWIEVTDICDLACPGCYRRSIEGHRKLEEIKEEIIACKKMTNCDRIAVAGGEPLIYPHIVEVIDFISKNGMKSIILTNGMKLNRDLAVDLKKTGLDQFLFHIDSGQKRPGWENKNETELNQLRQHYADLLWDLGGIQCGYNITIFRQTLEYVPHIVNWCRSNVHKVQHLSLITFRALPRNGNISYYAGGKKINDESYQDIIYDLNDISISTDQIYEVINNQVPGTYPAAYLNGTTTPETYKFLIIIHVGSKKQVYGSLGAKTVELSQAIYHLLKGRYSAFQKNSRVGKKIFLLSVIDKELRSTLKIFLKASIKNPLRIFENIYVQSVNLQQPLEVSNGAMNVCDGCVNMMIYKGKLVNSCRLDEYRLYGDELVPLAQAAERLIII